MENNVNQEVIEPQKKNNKKIILIIAIVISVIVLIGVLVFVGYNLLYKDKENKNQEEKYTLEVYKDGDGYCRKKGEYVGTCTEVGFTLKVESKNAKILNFDTPNMSSNKKNFMLYEDNGLKIYNINTKEITKINLENEDKIYNLVLSTKKDKVVGIIYNDYINNTASNYGYYNILNNKKMYENEYKMLFPTGNENYISATNYDLKNESRKEQIVILNTNEVKIEYTEELPFNCNYRHFEISSYNDKNIYMLREGCLGEPETPKIYSNNMKEFSKNLYDYCSYSIYKGNVYLQENRLEENNGIVKKFDFDGNLIDSKKFENNSIEQIINDYVLYKDNNILKLYNIDTKEEFEIVELKNKQLNVVPYISMAVEKLPPTKYYSKEEIKNINNITNSKIDEEGIYIVIGYEEKDSNGNSGMIYYFDEVNKTFKTYNIDNWECNGYECK